MYAINNKSAGVAFKNKYSVIAVGFPFETINSEEQRNQFIDAVFEFFKNGVQND